MPDKLSKGLLCKLLGHWPERSNIARTDTECCWFCRWCHDEMYDSDIDAAWKRPWYRWAAVHSMKRQLAKEEGT